MAFSWMVTLMEEFRNFWTVISSTDIKSFILILNNKVKIIYNKYLEWI